MVNNGQDINDKYFEKIGNSFADTCIGLLKRKYRMKQRRLELVHEKQKIHKQIYNLSLEIEKLEREIDSMVVKRL